MWFKVDDKVWSHPKFLALSPHAVALWLRAASYCAGHLTDGVVSPSTLAILQAKQRHCDELWTVGLWERIPEGGYRFHDWDDYQPTREQIEERRRREAEKKARYRSKSNRHPDTGRYT